jgi:glucose-1-phosphatase
MRAIRYVLFDLGGVLVELGGVSMMLRWMNGRMNEDELWAKWLGSPSVRSYEIGECEAHEFARGVIDEFALPVAEDVFLREFAAWMRGPFPGAAAFVRDLRGRCRVGCLSNTNEVHWNNLGSDHELLEHFHDAFASFRIGRMKPDLETFAHAIDRIGIPPEEILFLDDNRLNVEAAGRAGLVARRTVGLHEARAAVQEFDLMSTPSKASR